MHIPHKDPVRSVGAAIAHTGWLDSAYQTALQTKHTIA